MLDSIYKDRLPVVAGNLGYDPTPAKNVLKGGFSQFPRSRQPHRHGRQPTAGVAMEYLQSNTVVVRDGDKPPCHRCFFWRPFEGSLTHCSHQTQR